MKKSNIILIIVILIIISLFIFLGLWLDDDRNQPTSLDEVYSVYPEEVQELYLNMIDVSCHGDIYFNITEYDEELTLDKINSNDLMEYLFSYLDKDAKLTDKFDVSIVEGAAKKLFVDDFDFVKLIDGYSYGNYIYSLKDRTVTRKKTKCFGNKEYVAHLYGYSYDNNILNMDVTNGYLIDNNLYDLFGKKIGYYDGDFEKLSELYKSSPYYRITFIKIDGEYKLKYVALMRTY